MTKSIARGIAAFIALLFALSLAAHAAPAKSVEIRAVDDAWRAALPHDANAATQAYLDRLSPETVARADSYMEGGYWLILWNFVLTLLVTWALMEGQRAARFRDWAMRVGKRTFIADAIFGVGFWLASWVLTLPLTIYQFFIREHQYGLATQGFVAWFAEQLVSLAVSVIVVIIAVPPVMRLIRHFGERWWVAVAGFMIALQVIALMVTPVWIDPLFNTYKPVQDRAVSEQVLAMAHADSVPADNVYEFDASRQTTRISANVSGIFGTAQVRLNDNLLRRTSLPEIRAVMGHELGHYVLNHIYKMLAYLAILYFAGLAFAAWLMRAALRRWGARWSVSGVGDVASLPVLGLAVAAFFFFATPVVNTMVRVQEIEADRFGLNLSREPHGFSDAILQLVEYRKPDPGPVEEFLFFDHPSARFRIHDAMQWREAMQTDGPDKPWSAAKQ